MKYKNGIIAFVSAFLTGLLAHGYAFFHNFQIHDNVYNFYIGGTYTSGRWMLGILVRLTDMLSGTNYLHYAAPWYLGTLSLIWIGLGAALIVFLLDINNKIICIILGGVMASFPSVTATFGFMFTSAMYQFGTLLGIAGVLLACLYSEKISVKRIPVLLAGILLEAASIGVYQANLGVLLALTLIYFMKQMKESPDRKAKELLGLVLYHFLTTIAYLLAYYVILQMRLYKLGMELSGYQGIDEAGNKGIITYISGIGTAYKRFFLPEEHSVSNMFPGGIRIYYYFILIITILLAAFKGWKLFCKNRLAGILAGLAFVCMPVATNIAFIIGNDFLHSLMLYAQVCIFICFCFLLDDINWKDIGKLKYSFYAILIPAVAVIILYCRLANICYLKADYVQNAAEKYFNRLITKVEMTKGYDPSMQLAFIGDKPKPDETTFTYGQFADVAIFPFTYNTLIDDYNWPLYLSAICGVDFKITDSKQFEGVAEVESMPSYPAEGSIIIYEDTVIVKF